MCPTRKPPGWPEGVPLPPPIPERWWDDEKWLSDNINDLKQQYPDQWVSVVGRQVIAHGTDLGEVERATEEATGEKEFPVELVEAGQKFYSPWRVLSS